MINLLSRHVPHAGETYFQSFLWYYLWRLCHGELRVFERHHGDVYAVDFSPDESFLATAGARGAAVQIWKVPTGDPVQTLDATGVRIRNLTWSPDGRQLVATGDRETHIWEFDLGEPVVKRRGPVGHEWMSKFSSNSRLLATAGRDGTIRIWSYSTDLDCHCLPSAGPTLVYSFSPDGNMLEVFISTQIRMYIFRG